ncbi:Uncharacterized protein OBRU01_00359, partial [Operophtera brumata]
MLSALQDEIVLKDPDIKNLTSMQKFIDKVFTEKNNYIMHIAIVPFVLWELTFQPRNIPKSHLTNITIIA